MNKLDKLNNLISYIEASKNRSPRDRKTTINYDDINFDKLDLEIVVGSKVNIQSTKYDFNLDNNLLLDNYLKSIERYKKYQTKSPKYALETLDLHLDINLEIKQKFLVEKPRVKKTPLDIKRDISITLLENLKTSIFLYNNLHKTKKYEANFDDLKLDIGLEYKTKLIEKPIEYKNVSKAKKRLITPINLDKVSVLREKLKNIEKFKNSPKKHTQNNTDTDINIGVTITKSGKQLISLNQKNKVDKLRQLLESISSYKEKRNELY
jgi:hypothetical protein